MKGNINNNNMGLGKSIKMYLTIFVATTCIYMLIYQYHMSTQEIDSNEVIKHQDKSSLSSSFASYFWALTSNGSLANINDNSNTIATTTSTAASSLSTVSLAATGATLMTSSGSSPPSSSSTSLTSSPTEKRAANTSKSLLTTAGATTTTTTTTIRTTTTTRKQTTTSTNTTRTTSTRGTKPKANQFGTLVHATSSLAATSASTPALGRVRRPREAFVPVPEPPPLYIITPTYRRPEQLAELTRLGYTLKHVTNLLWLVIEDANETSPLVFDILDRIGVPYHYLLAPMPAQYRIKRFKPRGVSNRNRGLAYIRANATEGVFYFADDDNTYDVSLFEQMRYTKMVSMWPVGLVTNTGVSSPIVRDGKLNGFYDGWIGGRKYPVDMAGFAVSVKFLLQRPNATMPFVVGYEEDGFLRSLKPLSNDDIELLANKCTEILTWHTQTKKNPSAIALNQTRYGGTNLIAIDKLLVRS